MVSSCVYDNAETNAQKRSIHEGPKPNLFQYWAHTSLILLLPTKKLHTLSPLFKKMGQSRPLFVYFSVFHTTISTQIEKSKGGVLGIRACGCRMVGGD